jgi:general stress protein YciG
MTKKQRRDYMRSIGAKGGAATKRKHGTKHYQLIGRKGQKALIDKLSKL